MTAEFIPFDPARVSVTVWCYPFEETRTPNNPCYWVATCEIAGRVFEARSRRDAPRELARAFLAAGIPDRPMRITYAGVRGTRRYGSFHAEAAWTTVESATVPVRRGRFSSLADAEGSERLNSVIGGWPENP